MLKQHVGITIFLLYKQNKNKKTKTKNRWNSDIQNSYSEILNFFEFSPIFRKKIAIFRSGMFLWRHNYVTPWPIVLILVCMNKEYPYLPIDTKINFHRGFGSENLGKGLQQPTLIRRVTKNSLVRRRLTYTVFEKNYAWIIDRLLLLNDEKKKIQ